MHRDGIRLLLGGFPEELGTIEQWLIKTQEQMREEEDQTLAPDSKALQTRFEHACALLYDSRLPSARDQFQMVAAVAAPDLLGPTARLGTGYAFNLLRRYKAAAHFFEGVTKQPAQDSFILDLAKCFVLLNRSDWGEALTAAEVDWLKTMVDSGRSSGGDALHFLLYSFHSYTLSRIFLRSGHRSDALTIVEKVAIDEHFESLPLIQRGLLLRMRGVLLAVLGHSQRGREDLKQAIGIFVTAGFRIGEVRAALSLARTHAPTDRKQTREYLERARSVLNETAPPSSASREGRHMPGEQADLFSRLGDLEFADGDFDAALTLYKKDLAVLEGMAVDGEEALPRATAYAHRNIGRALLAQKRFSEACQELEQSAMLFERVDDEMNTFFSLARMCDALLEEGSYPALHNLVKKLGALIEPRKTRQKEKAILCLLRARLHWKQEGDAATTLHSIKLVLRVLASFPPDHYQAKALIFQAEVLDSMGDSLEARARLLDARRITQNLEMGDLKREIELRLAQIGVPSTNGSALVIGRSEVERQFELRGFFKLDVSIVYADLRGFTSLCAGMDPSLIAEFIAEFAFIVSRCASRQDGLPVRFLGDCVVAIFGTRVTSERMEVFAARATTEMFEMFKNLRQRWKRERPEISDVGLGFGIATGTVVAGRFGNEDLSEFSVIGEAVNLAARLQGIAGSGEVVTCPATTAALVEEVPALKFEHRTVELKGLGERAASIVAIDELIQRLS